MQAKRVIVGLSGGVDSAVSAWLLQQKGYEVQGLFMKNWEREDYQMPCTATQDLADVRRVCETLGIVLHTANFSEEYWNQVFNRFLGEYRSGRTPNPDILCNKTIKFKVFLEYAEQLGADCIATGHYASIETVNATHQLTCAADVNKDQTYFLYTLQQQQLARSIFPLAELTKPKVREIAATIGLANHAKKDSVGICFIGKRNFKSFLKRYISASPGPVMTSDGDVLGEHEGLPYYTLGQRQGLKIGGQSGYNEKPWYVASKDFKNNILQVVQGADHPTLYQRQLRCSDASWVSEKTPPTPLQCFAKIRYRQTAVPCVVSKASNSTYHVVFETPQWAITPGQAIVFYQGNVCLGGGTIDTSG